MATNEIDIMKRQLSFKKLSINHKASNLLFNSNSLNSLDGFTIVELLVVIVVIGILASISIVSYTGITQKATEVSIQSDLSNSKKQFEIYRVFHGSYPTTLDANNCPTAPVADTGYCLKSSQNNSFSGYVSEGHSFGLEVTNTNGSIYSITQDSSPKPGSNLAITDPTNWMIIGSQIWARFNLNVGTRIAGSTAQTNNGGTNIVEKYCYNDLESNCTNNANGGLYQWDEAMNYSTTEGAQGICPADSHIPTDNEWKVLEMHLGMAPADADLASVWRGTNQGIQLKPGGSSGLNIPLAGYRRTDGTFGNLSADADLWTSTQSVTNAWTRDLNSANDTVLRNTDNKVTGFSIRCIANP